MVAENLLYDIDGSEQDKTSTHAPKVTKVMPKGEAHCDSKLNYDVTKHWDKMLIFSVTVTKAVVVIENSSTDFKKCFGAYTISLT